MGGVKTGQNFPKQPILKVPIGVPLICVPIIATIPFAVIWLFLVTSNLKLMRAENIRSWQDFVPHWISRR